MAFPDELVGNLESPEIQKLPNKHHYVNPWQSFYRFKPFHWIPFLRSWERTRPPRLFVMFGECPSLIRALAAGLVGLAAGVFLLV